MAHLYEVLGIASNAGATEIKVAFHRLAKTYHPDLHAGDMMAEERFKAINHAYGILGKRNPALCTMRHLRWKTLASASGRVPRR